jgi:heptosyltransferase II
MLFIGSGRPYRSRHVAINVSRSAVIQVKPGIGDVIWHLPFVRTIAAAAPGGTVTFLAPPSSHAKGVLAAEPAVAETIYFKHHGSELARAVALVRLVALLRRCRFSSIWILDRTTRAALAAMLAGIPNRIGIGLGRQRLFITNAGIDHGHFHDHPIDWLRALMAAMALPVPSTEPELRVASDLLAIVGKRFDAAARPWIVLGVGASHPVRDWPDEHSAQLLAELPKLTQGTTFLIGGSEQAARANALIARSRNAAAINACEAPIAETLALLRHADLYVGPDSGPMNLAAAVGTPAFALFGATPVLGYSRHIRPIVPPGGHSPDGMKRISAAQVLERIGPHLSSGKAWSAS